MSSLATCPICIEDLIDKVKASPDNCEHTFCLPCLEKWAKLGSYCPIDRKRFKKIFNLETNRAVQRKPQKRKRKRDVYDFTTKCEVCSGCTDSNIMLLCDCCDLGYHIHCLTPPLKEVPAGLWFCPTCISIEEKLKKKNGITKEVEAEQGSIYESEIRKKVIKEPKNCEKGDMIKPKNLDNSKPNIKNNSTLQTCYDIISEFEDMIVKKKCSKEPCNSNDLDSTINKIDKIYKTFDTASKDFNSEHSKQLKTYSVANIHRKTRRIKSFDIEKVKSYLDTTKSNTIDICLNKKNMSDDIDLPNRNLADEPHEFLNVGDLYNDFDVFLENKNVNKTLNSTSNNIPDKLCSEENDILNEDALGNLSFVNIFEDIPIHEKKSQRSFTHFEDMPVLKRNSKGSFKNFEDMPVLKRNSQGSFAKKSFDKNFQESPLESKRKSQKKLIHTVIASHSEDSEPSSSHVMDKTSKGKNVNNNKGAADDSLKLQSSILFSETSSDLPEGCISHSSNTSSSSSYFNSNISSNNRYSETNTSVDVENDFSYQNDNSNFSLSSDSDQTEIYSPCSVQSSDKGENEFFSDEDSMNFQDKNSFDSVKYLSRNALNKMVYTSDGSLYLPVDKFRSFGVESKKKNKSTPSCERKNSNKAVKAHINNNETTTSEKNLLQTGNSILSKSDEFTLNKKSLSDNEKFTNNFKSTFKVVELSSDESLSDYENQLLNSEPLSGNLESAFISKNDLKDIIMGPDGTLFLPKLSLKAKKAEALSKNVTSTETSSEHNKNLINYESPFSRKSANLSNYAESKKSMTNENCSISGNHITQLLNESCSNSTLISENKQCQPINKYVSLDHDVRNEKIANEPEPFSEFDASDIQITCIKDNFDIKLTSAFQNVKSLESEPTFHKTYPVDVKCDEKQTNCSKTEDKIIYINKQLGVIERDDGLYMV